MITFIDGEISLFGEDFHVSNNAQNISENILKYSYVPQSYNSVVEFHYKEGFGIEDISAWKWTHDHVGISTFENEHGKTFALRFDLMQDSAAKFGREKFGDIFGKNKPHVFISYSQESQSRGIDIEHAVGFLMLSRKDDPESRIPFVIVEIVPNAKTLQLTEDVSYKMGEILKNTHNKGIIHAHPHLGNWILIDGAPRLVDGKGVLLDCDFPWHTCTGRTHTFEAMASNDCAHLLRGELGNSSPNFDAFQDGYRSI